jgi:hypothetical protein
VAGQQVAVTSTHLAAQSAGSSAAVPAPVAAQSQHQTEFNASFNVAAAAQPQCMTQYWQQLPQTPVMVNPYYCMQLPFTHMPAPSQNLAWSNPANV